MSVPLARPALPRDFGPVLAAVAARAGDADAGRIDLGEDMADLAASGLLERLCSGPLGEQLDLLRRLGRASLSVGRLAEGHMNALELIRLYGTPAQKARHQRAAASGAIYGVWGADAAVPVGIVEADAGRARLGGAKRFCSGLGILSWAVVTAATPAGAQLVLAEVADPGRQDASGWTTTGMRATASGEFDFDGIDAELLGSVGDYVREPHFEGGVWRYAALHVGGIEALVAATEAVAQGQAPEVLHRYARLASLGHAARLMVEDAARRVAGSAAGGGEVAEAVARALLAREFVEAAALEAMALTDRLLGTRGFVVGTAAERVRRDLGFFLRQADLDGKLTRAANALLAARPAAGS